MTGHVLDVAWLCLGCGSTVPAGEAVYRQGDAWRCGPCAYGRQRQPRRRTPAPAPAVPEPRTPPQRPLPPATPFMPRFGNPERPHVRKAKGRTLEELLKDVRW